MNKSGRILIILIMTSAMLTSGCRTVKYVPIERVTERTDTVNVVKQRIDTVVNSDTVRLYTRGDTVYSEVTRWRIRTKQRTDTVYRSVEVRDSVPYAVEVERIVEVTRKRSWWETTLLWVGVIAIVAAIGGLILRKFMCK